MYCTSKEVLQGRFVRASLLHHLKNIFLKMKLHFISKTLFGRRRFSWFHRDFRFCTAPLMASVRTYINGLLIGDVELQHVDVVVVGGELREVGSAVRIAARGNHGVIGLNNDANTNKPLSGYAWWRREG